MAHRMLTLAFVAILPTLTACGALKFETRFAENVRPLESSHSATSSSGPWGRTSTFTDSVRKTYTLGRGLDRMRCYSNEGGTTTTTNPKNGSRSYNTAQSVSSNCFADPELPAPTKK